MAQGLFGLPSMAPNLGTQPETHGGWFRAGYRFSLEKQLASLRHLFPAENLCPARNRQSCELESANKFSFFRVRPWMPGQKRSVDRSPLPGLSPKAKLKHIVIVLRKVHRNPFLQILRQFVR